jgi:hypothetical protein
MYALSVISILERSNVVLSCGMRRHDIVSKTPSITTIVIIIHSSSRRCFQRRRWLHYKGLEQP